MAESDDFAQLFERLASWGEQGSATEEADAELQRRAEAVYRELIAPDELSADRRASLIRVAKRLDEHVRVNMQALVQAATAIGEILDEPLDPDVPEHVGVFSARVDALSTLAAKARATLDLMKLSHEIKRRVGDAATDNEGGA